MVRLSKCFVCLFVHHYFIKCLIYLLQTELACNSQILEMLECFKSNDFDQSICAPQVTAFKNCYQTHLVCSCNYSLCCINLNNFWIFKILGKESNRQDNREQG